MSLRRAPGTIRRDLRASVADSATFSVMVGIGEAYLGAFALALGLGQIVAGLISTVPMIAGAVLQLGSPACVRRFGSHRRWVVLCATVQASSFIPLIVGALAGRMPTIAVFMVATLYWGAGMATGPAWNSWIETLVPPRIRARYFSRRTRIAQAAVLLGLVSGGLMLHAGSLFGRPLLTFALLFLVAFGARMLSARLLAQQTEPFPLAESFTRASTLGVLQNLRGGREGKLLVYMLAVQVSVYVSAAYVTPYMLGHLRLSYAEYMSLSATTLIAKSAAAPLFGEIARRFGPRHLLGIGGLLIVPVAGLLTVSPALHYLFFVQLAAGVAWAAYELATFLMLFETIPREDRVHLLTIFNFANAFATVTGSILGAYLAEIFSKTGDFYPVLFLVSTAGRGLTLLLLRRIPKLESPPMRLSTRSISVPPFDGAIDRPVIPSIEVGDPQRSKRR